MGFCFAYEQHFFTIRPAHRDNIEALEAMRDKRDQHPSKNKIAFTPSADKDEISLGMIFTFLCTP